MKEILLAKLKDLQECVDYDYHDQIEELIISKNLALSKEI